MHQVVPWLLARQLRRTTGDDPALDGPSDSPALERYRAAKADLAEMQLERERGELISRDHVRAALGRWAGPLRRAGEILEKQHGQSARKVLDEALAQCDEIAESGPFAATAREQQEALAAGDALERKANRLFDKLTGMIYGPGAAS